MPVWSCLAQNRGEEERASPRAAPFAVGCPFSFLFSFTFSLCFFVFLDWLGKAAHCSCARCLFFQPHRKRAISPPPLLVVSVRPLARSLLIKERLFFQGACPLAGMHGGPKKDGCNGAQRPPFFFGVPLCGRDLCGRLHGHQKKHWPCLHTKGDDDEARNCLRCRTSVLSTDANWHNKRVRGGRGRKRAQGHLRGAPLLLKKTFFPYNGRGVGGGLSRQTG